MLKWALLGAFGVELSYLVLGVFVFQLFAFSDAVWALLIPAFITAFGMWISYRQKMADLAAKVEIVDTKVEVVAASVESVGAKVEHVDRKVEKVAVVVDATHELSNSASLAQDKMIWDLKQERADRTHKAQDVTEAQAAKLIYEEHKAKQDAVDAGAKDGKIEPASDEKSKGDT